MNQLCVCPLMKRNAYMFSAERSRAAAWQGAMINSIRACPLHLQVTQRAPCYSTTDRFKEKQMNSSSRLIEGYRRRNPLMERGDFAGLRFEAI